MRTITRLGVAAAATALASATALAGAAAAGAQFGTESGSVAAGDFTMNSPSTLVSDRTSDGVDVTYTNKTTRSVACFGISAPSNVVKAFDDHVKRYGAASLTEDNGAKMEAKLASLSGDLEGKLFLLGLDGTVSEGELGIDPGLGDVLTGPGKSAIWDVPAPTGYAAAALVLCGEPNEDFEDEESMPFSYVEYVSTNTSGGGASGSLGFLGSLGS